VRAAVAISLVLGLVVAGCGGDSEEAGSSECRRVDAPAARSDGGQTAPQQALAAGTTHRLVFTTNCGDFTITLDQELAPKASASLVSLARNGYFDDTIIHRIVPGFVIQGGDPTQSGGGGPGYSTVDPPPADAAYTKGVVAMAKSADEPAGAAGSQFYVVTGEDTQLPADYAVLGKVVKGLDVADRIGQLGDPNSGEQGTPLQSVVIEEVTVDVIS
jgi:peptidyl-prolyl cis-trans isomerase B (cyclophilin B)